MYISNMKNYVHIAARLNHSQRINSLFSVKNFLLDQVEGDFGETTTLWLVTAYNLILSKQPDDDSFVLH